jgi:hypothetical protein
LASEPGDKVFHFDFMLHGRLLVDHGHRCESLADIAYPIVLLQGCESGSDRFIECLRGDLYGVLNFSKVSYRYGARSENHDQERTIFVFCSPSVYQTQQSVRSTPFLMWPLSINSKRDSWPSLCTSIRANCQYQVVANTCVCHKIEVAHTMGLRPL